MNKIFYTTYFNFSKKQPNYMVHEFGLFNTKNLINL